MTFLDTQLPEKPSLRRSNTPYIKAEECVRVGMEATCALAVPDSTKVVPFWSTRIRIGCTGQIWGFSTRQTFAALVAMNVAIDSAVAR